MSIIIEHINIALLLIRLGKHFTVVAYREQSDDLMSRGEGGV
jgi:hypothetical protein